MTYSFSGLSPIGPLGPMLLETVTVAERRAVAPATTVTRRSAVLHLLLLMGKDLLRSSGGKLPC